MENFSFGFKKNIKKEARCTNFEQILEKQGQRKDTSEVLCRILRN